MSNPEQERIRNLRITSVFHLGSSALIGAASYLKLEHASTVQDRIIGTGFGTAAACFLGASGLAIYNSLHHSQEDQNARLQHTNEELGN